MTWLQDLRYALRAFRSQPLHAGVTVLVLAIAIGANTTVFSLINGLFLRPLPYPDGDRLVMVSNAYEKLGLTNIGTSIPDYLDRRAQAPSLEELGIYRVVGRALGGEGPTQEVVVAMASPSLFGVLGIAPQLGRAFTEQEGTLGSDAVAVLSHDLWMQRFGGRADVVGKDVRLDGQTFQIVGVMPTGFAFPNRNVQVWVPYAFTPLQASDAGRGNEFSTSIGRLKPDATVAQLNSELGVIVRRLADRLPAIQDAVTVAGFTGKAQSWRQAQVGNLSQLLLVLQATVLAVLLIACANLANLQLARLTSRRRELTLRTTLGATRAQLLRLVLVEDRGTLRRGCGRRARGCLRRSRARAHTRPRSGEPGLYVRVRSAGVRLHGGRSDRRGVGSGPVACAHLDPHEHRWHRTRRWAPNGWQPRSTCDARHARSGADRC